MGKPKRDHIVTARLTDDEYAELLAQVARSGMSVSEFLRQAIKPRNPTRVPQFKFSTSTSTMTSGADPAATLITYNAA